MAGLDQKTEPTKKGNDQEQSDLDPYKVAEGQLTFDVEGSEGGRFHSRVLHVPGSSSGVTIGRGYDMKERSREEVIGHLEGAGVSPSLAGKIAGGAGLVGQPAKDFVKENKDIEITPEQQQVLFSVVYDEKESYAAGRLKKWSGTDLSATDPVIRDLIVDLFYRGDMTKKKWEDNDFKTIVENKDYDRLLTLLQTRTLWGNVDTNRYTKRIEYIQNRGNQGGKAGGEQKPAGETTEATKPDTQKEATTPKAPTAGKSLQGSVGAGGKNLTGDIFLVQQQLSDRGISVGKIDGKIGSKTIGAIERFQSTFMTHPDGRIDVGGNTQKKLFASKDPVNLSSPKTESTTTTKETTPKKADTKPESVTTPGDLSRVRSGVKLTPALVAGIRTVSPYLPSPTVVTSGLRSDEDQAALIHRYFQQKGGPATIKDVEARRQWLLGKGMKIARVGSSLHRTGLAFDLSGGSLSAIQSGVLKCAKEKTGEFKFSRTIFERANNCVHVELTG
ncbi:MAG: peptidoglycan-binding protein [Myxococcales bacterium]|nr:peptidoglycan-binding protein [Myxococcales bacterium]